jgi:hypothetical protein
MLLRMALIAVVVAQCENQVLAQTEPTGLGRFRNWWQKNIDTRPVEPAKSMWARYTPSEEVYELGAQEESYRPLIKQYATGMRDWVRDSMFKRAHALTKQDALERSEEQEKNIIKQVMQAASHPGAFRGISEGDWQRVFNYIKANPHDVAIQDDFWARIMYDPGMIEKMRMYAPELINQSRVYSYAGLRGPGNLSAISSQPTTPLVRAIELGSVAVAKTLLDNGAIVDDAALMAINNAMTEIESYPLNWLGRERSEKKEQLKNLKLLKQELDDKYIVDRGAFSQSGVFVDKAFGEGLADEQQRALARNRVLNVADMLRRSEVPVNSISADDLQAAIDYVQSNPHDGAISDLFLQAMTSDPERLNEFQGALMRKLSLGSYYLIPFYQALMNQPSLYSSSGEKITPLVHAIEMGNIRGLYMLFDSQGGPLNVDKSALRAIDKSVAETEAKFKDLSQYSSRNAMESISPSQKRAKELLKQKLYKELNEKLALRDKLYNNYLMRDQSEWHFQQRLFRDYPSSQLSREEKGW